MMDEPDYVNELPDGCPVHARRCQYVFEGLYEFKRQIVRGSPCGLPVPDDEIGREDHLCYFHSERPREGDEDLKQELQAAVGSGAYLGEAQLAQAPLAGAALRDALLPHASLQGADLYRAKLCGADLSGASLQRADLWQADLQDARLIQADLQDAFAVRANLGHAWLWEANLRGADLREANLECAQLQHAKLARAVLSEANLQRTTLFMANLQGAHLLAANLHGAKLSQAMLHGAVLLGATLRNSDLGFADIGPLQVSDVDTDTTVEQVPDLRRADLRGALYGRATIAAEADLSGAIIDCPIRDELCARSDEVWDQVIELHELRDTQRPTFSACEETYRQLKLNYQESGDYQEAGKFFVREMECKRAQAVGDNSQAAAFWGRAGALLVLLPVIVGVMLGHIAQVPLDRAWWLLVPAAILPVGAWAWPMRQRAVLALMYLFCGYGERPAWIGYWIAGVVAVFAFLYGWLGIRDLQTGRYAVGPGVAWPSWEGFTTWLTCAYFSIITFTSLGYADLAPGPGLGRALAGIEAGLGFVLMSLLLVCIVRKFAR